MGKKRNVEKREMVRSASFVVQEQIKDAVEKKREERIRRGR